VIKVSEQPEPAGPVDPRELRVSDAERTHVVNVLQKAIGHGMLSLDEFTERTDRALAAKTRGELNSVLVDLPGVTHTDAQAPVRARPVELRASFATLKRHGKWSVPRELVIYNRLGGTDLDFSEAHIPYSEVRIELNCGGGSVRLMLPEGASVVTDDVRMTAGSIKDKVGGGTGRPRFVLSGSVTAGSLVIRKPSYLRIGNLLIHSSLRITRAAD
jgi:hypothetical protein